MADGGRFGAKTKQQQQNNRCYKNDKNVIALVSNLLGSVFLGEMLAGPTTLTR